MKITLEHGPFFTFLLRSEQGASRLVQFDADFPSVARTFGWSGSGEETPESIRNAYEFLERTVGARVDDPGYF